MSTRLLQPEALTVPPSPYVGLGPYSETDAAFFFGREVWREIIIDNLKAYRLTLLYGNSGVGKSSVLRAGVVHELAERGQRNYERDGDPGHVVVTVREWRGDPLATLVREIDAAAQALPTPHRAGLTAADDPKDSAETAAATETLERAEQDDALDSAELSLPAPVTLLRRTLASCAERAGGRVFVILDQFEEYFLYHPRPELRPSFEAALADAITFRVPGCSFLISIREDAVALLDRFEPKIPGLFNNFLRLGPLGRAEARAAIEKPLEEYGRRTGRSLTVDPRMVEAILDGVETGKVRVGGGGAGVVEMPTRAERDHIETPYLQLVLSRLWDEEQRAGCDELRWQTFEGLGRAQGIVQNHLDTTMKELPEPDQDVAAKLFNFLVTPSGTKIAQRADDLANYAKVSSTVATSILERLSGKLRILRRLDQGAYEIYHDILAAPILDWRSRWQQRQQRHRERRKILLLSIAVAVAFLIAGAMVWFWLSARSAEHQAQRANATAGDLALASAAQGLLDTRPDVSLVLALAAYRRAPDNLPAVPASMLAALEQAIRSGSVGILHGSGNTVTAVAFDPRTATLASAGADGTVRFWSTRTHRQTRGAFRVPGGVVFSLAYSPDGRTLVTGGRDGRVRFWDLSTGAPIGKPLLVRSGSVISVAYSPDGRRLAAAAYGGGAGLVSIADGKPNGPLTVLPNSSLVRGVAFSSDSRTLATVANDGTIELLASADGHPMRATIPVPGGTQLYAVAFSARRPDRLAVAGQSGRVWLMDPSSPVPIPLAPGGTGNVDSLAFSPDGRSLAAATADDSVEVWDVGRQRLEGPPLVGHTGVVTSVVFSPDGRTLASASTDRTIRLWPMPIRDQLGHALKPKLKFAWDVSFTRDGQQLAAGGRAGIFLWKVVGGVPTGTGRQLTRLPASAVALSPDGRSLVSGDDGKLRVWDTATRTTRPIPGPSDRHWWSLAFSPNGRLLAAAGRNGTITILDPFSGRTAKLLNPHSGIIFSVAFNPQGTLLASGGDDRVIRIWNVATGHQVAELTGDSDAVFAVAFSPSGTILASGSADNTVRLWDATRWREIGEPLTGHHGYVWTVAFTEDSRVLASGDDDGVIRFWDVASRTEIGQPFSAGGPRIQKAAFSSTSGALVSAGGDGWVRVWPVITLPPTGALTRKVCGLVGTGLSHAEWKEYAPPRLAYDDPCS